MAATVVTWFVVQAVLAAAAPLGPRLEAITGFVAIAVLLVVMNWFVHKLTGVLLAVVLVVGAASRRAS